METRLTDDDQNGHGISGNLISFYQSPNIFSDGTFIGSKTTGYDGFVRLSFTITSKIVESDKFKLSTEIKEIDHRKKVISVQILKDKNGREKVLVL